jgi:hypothetical protein
MNAHMQSFRAVTKFPRTFEFPQQFLLVMTFIKGAAWAFTEKKQDLSHEERFFVVSPPFRNRRLPTHAGRPPGMAPPAQAASPDE